jgi:hypothetical protein
LEAYDNESLRAGVHTSTLAHFNPQSWLLVVSNGFVLARVTAEGEDSQQLEIIRKYLIRRIMFAAPPPTGRGMGGRQQKKSIEKKKRKENPQQNKK